MKKLVFSLMMIIGFTLSSQAQTKKTKINKKIETKINKKIEKINLSIIKSDKSAALTHKQKEQIFEILFEAQKNMKAIKKAHKGEDNLKELLKAESKKANKRINKEVLSKQQRAAKKKTRLNNKNKK